MNFQTINKLFNLNQRLFNYNFYNFSIHIISLMLGFFISSILSTMPAHTGDWSIISASIIITINEIISKYIYQIIRTNKTYIIIYFINDIKVGIIYGLFVDAFKLGS